MPKLFKASVFSSFLGDDYHQEIRNRNLSYILATFAGAGILVVLCSLYTGVVRDGILGGISGFFFLLMFCMGQSGYTRLVSGLSLTYLTLFSTYTMSTASGINDISIIIVPMTISLGSLLLNRIPFIILVVMNVTALIFIGHNTMFGDSASERAQYFFRAEDVWIGSIIVIASAVAIRLMNGNYLFAMDKISIDSRNRKEILDAIDEGIILLDSDSLNITDINDYVSTKLTLDPCSVIGEPFCDIFMSDTLDQNECAMKSSLAIAKDESVVNGEHYFAKLGKRSQIWLELTFKKVEFGSTSYVLIVARDISAKKQMSKELSMSKHLSSLGLLAGGVAHDFNNQLSGIMGFADLIKGSTDISEIKKYAALITKCSHASSTLTTQLLAFARMDDKNYSLFSLNSLINDVMDILTHSFPKNIVCLFEDNSDKEINIFGDSGQIQNVLINLAINSRDVMPDGGTLQFSLSRFMHDDAPCARVTVTDTGSGINSDHIDKIFEPFFTTKEFGQGTGMGLAASYGIMKEHSGEIRVASTSEKGTVFEIELPISTANDTLPATVQSEKQSTTDDCLIYLIDDEEIVRRVTDALLQAKGFKVKSFADVSTALDEFRSEKHDNTVLLIDRDMPDINGIEGSRLFREIHPEIPTIVCSGLCDEEHFMTFEWLRYKALFVQKPCSTDDLIATIERALVFDTV